MPIPKDILSVKRPRNTVVIAYGKNKQLFAVRQRVGCENRNGRHVPINGPTIGHIINNEYVPIDNEAPVPVSQAPVDIKDWADIILCDELFKDVQDELLKVYDTKDAMKIYNIAILRVCQHGIKDSELKEAYETSFLSELYPNVALSRNTVSTFLNDLGKAYSRIQTFMKNRADNVRMDDHLLIDGTLKTDNSIVNSLSDFSRKARLKGTRDISILYAFDLESMEPVCSKCYPGNMLDETAYEDFIKENGIKKGIIVGDKGFPESCADEEFRTNPDLHYLNPIKRNSTLIEAHHLHDYTGILSCDDKVTYRKEKAFIRVVPNGSILSAMHEVQPQKNKHGLQMQRRPKHTVSRFCMTSRKSLVRSFLNVIWIWIRKQHTRRIPNAGRSRFSCVTIKPHVISTTPAFKMTTQ